MSENHTDFDAKKYPMGAVVLTKGLIGSEYGHIVGFSKNCFDEIILVIRMPLLADGSNELFEDVAIHWCNVEVL